jgi:hypothetical protein
MLWPIHPANTGSAMESLEAMTLDEICAWAAQNAQDVISGGMSRQECQARTKAIVREYRRRVALYNRYGTAALEPGFTPPK